MKKNFLITTGGSGGHVVPATILYEHLSKETNVTITTDIRGLRYFGPSQMSLYKLLIHSFSIIAVFKYQVFLRSTFIIIILAYLNVHLGNISIFLQILVVLFNLMIFIVSLRENEKELKNSQNNLDTTKNITH